jgi:hypothetical protein
MTFELNDLVHNAVDCIHRHAVPPSVAQPRRRSDQHSVGRAFRPIFRAHTDARSYFKFLASVWCAPQKGRAHGALRKRSGGRQEKHEPSEQAHVTGIVNPPMFICQYRDSHQTPGNQSITQSMISIQAIWRRITSTRYTRAMEAAARTESALQDEIARLRADVDRLRGENRALLNSILGIAGVPPILVELPDRRSVEPGRSVATPPEPLPARRHSESPARSTEDGESLFPAPPPGENASGRDLPGTNRPRNDSRHPDSPARQLATPLRRRSWHQINRMLEVQAARKPVSGEQ